MSRQDFTSQPYSSYQTTSPYTSGLSDIKNTSYTTVPANQSRASFITYTNSDNLYGNLDAHKRMSVAMPSLSSNILGYEPSTLLPSRPQETYTNYSASINNSSVPLTGTSIQNETLYTSSYISRPVTEVTTGTTDEISHTRKTNADIKSAPEIKM